MRLLITGFDPFGGESINPAWEAVKLLPNMVDEVEVIKMQIPTVFHKSVEVLLEGVEEHKPDVVICVGQAGGRFDVSIERVGINIDDARIADNEGNQPIDVPVYEDGESAYFTTLPIKAMVEESKKNGVPSSVSNTAGTFVCNHILYALLHHINKNNVAKKGGFIHVPYIPAQVLGKKNMPFMSLEMIASGLEGCIRAIGQNDTDIKVTGGTEF